MAYRNDPDLDILSKASNEDLLLLADVLMYSDEEHRKKESRRIAATLHKTNMFSECYPNNLHAIWKDIAEELQKFGGNSAANLICRFNKGVQYREILIDVCKLQKVKNVDFKKDSISKIENAFLEKVIILAIEKMSEEEKRQLLDGLRNVEGFIDKIDPKQLCGDFLYEIVSHAFKVGGFKAFIFTSQLINAISKAVTGQALALGTNFAITRYIAFFAGPWGWAFTSIISALSLLDPNKDATLKAVAVVAYIRHKNRLLYHK